jgi:hypothetical protein
LRLAYLTVADTFAVLRLLPMSDRHKDTEHRDLIVLLACGRNRRRAQDRDDGLSATTA